MKRLTRISGLVLTGLFFTTLCFGAWDKTKPANNEKLKDTPAEVRDNWEALELGTDAALQITNAKVSATAGIVDTKLATISTAGKVNGAALTGLASIPSGAGSIPNTNLATINTAGKVDGAALTGLANIPAGAGVIPAANVPSTGFTLPSGAVFFMMTGSCPAGSTDVTATYSNKFIRVNATQGSTGGSDTLSILEANLPSHTHPSGTLTAASAGAHTHTMSFGNVANSGQDIFGSGNSGNKATSSAGDHTHTISGNTGSAGSGSAATITNPYVTCKMCQVN
ncbi:MAG: hypothetical protein PHC54_05525 [Candidatus Omnitrophica bacterium]|nr:hypothetical protein [Candidatus Omnitrophota bacterium]MDD5592639.1 hypothetical protein [Candidatus Omnitrophota bacterium]